MSTQPTFVQLPITTDPDDLADLAIAFLQATWDGWTPNDGDMEVVQIEALAPMAANAANIASNMPMAALIAFGVLLLNQPYGTGSPAYTTVTFTMVDDAGYEVLAGSQIAIDGYAFQVVADSSTTPGETTVSVLVASTLSTAAANGLIGSSVTPISTPAWVVGMSVDSPTAGGSDPQTDLDYVNQLSADRMLVSRAIVTLVDFELVALDQPDIGRAHADTIGPRDVQVTVLGKDGAVVPEPDKVALEAIYADPTQRIANVTSSVVDPTFTTINVTWAVVSEPSFDPVAMTASINAVIAAELSPLGWGIPDPGAGGTSWINDPYVRINRLVALIGSVQGVQYVSALTLNGGTVDVEMSGLVALPELGTCTGEVG